jgi:hypothetical protein
MSNLPKLLELCEELNADDFHVGFSFAGHVDSFDVVVHRGGFQNGCELCSKNDRIKVADFLTPHEQSVNFIMKNLTALHTEWRKEHPRGADNV